MLRDGTHDAGEGAANVEPPLQGMLVATPCLLLPTQLVNDGLRMLLRLDCVVTGAGIHT